MIFGTLSAGWPIQSCIQTQNTKVRLQIDLYLWAVFPDQLMFCLTLLLFSLIRVNAPHLWIYHLRDLGLPGVGEMPLLWITFPGLFEEIESDKRSCWNLCSFSFGEINLTLICCLGDAAMPIPGIVQAFCMWENFVIDSLFDRKPV